MTTVQGTVGEITGTGQLGKVTSVHFGTENHGVLTLMIMLDFGGSGQGFGGYTLDDVPLDMQSERRGTAHGMEYVLSILRLFKVDSLDKLIGRSVFALRESGDDWGTIIGLQMPDYDGGKRFLVWDWQAENKT